MERKTACGGKWDSSLTILNTRPQREGMWFLAHANTLASLEVEDAIDINAEFFAHHPNGVAATAGFHAIKLSQELLEQYSDKIRVCSYRWREVMGIGPDSVFAAPGNYGWFFDAIREDDLIGWVDFCSNIGASVDWRDTMKYMGSLYANYQVKGDWLMSTEKLTSALTRGWIFQEMAFGPLCTDAVRFFFKDLRQLGLAIVNGGKKAIKAYIAATTAMSSLCSRRGYPTSCLSSPMLTALSKESSIDEQISWVPKGCSTKQALHYQSESWDDIYSDASYFHPVAIFAMTDEEEYKAHSEELVRVLCAPLHHTLGSTAEFFNLFSESLIMGFLECELTYEKDRLNAVTSVAKAIAERLGTVLSNEQVMTEAWACMKAKMVSGEWGFIGANEIAAPPSIMGVALGGLQFKGTPVKLSGEGKKCRFSYRTANGGKCSGNLDDAFECIFDLSGLENDEGSFWHEEFECECVVYLCTDESVGLMAAVGVDVKTKAPRCVVVAGLEEFGVGEWAELPARETAF